MYKYPLSLLCLFVVAVGCGDRSSVSQKPVIAGAHGGEVIDGWEVAQPRSADTRFLSKEGDEVMIYYDSNPSSDAVSTVRMAISNAKNNDGEVITVGNMSGYMDAINLGNSDTLLPKVMIDAYLEGPDGLLSVSLDGDGSVGEKLKVVKRILAEFESKWIYLFVDKK